MFKVGNRVSYIWRGDDKGYTGTVIERLEYPYKNYDISPLLIIQTDDSDIVHHLFESTLIKLIKKEKDIFMKIIEDSANPEEFKTGAIRNHCNFDKKEKK